jgi:hypothetical protein
MQVTRTVLVQVRVGGCVRQSMVNVGEMENYSGELKK